ncbi:hypothetical protein EII29_11205 [Leptotrichia sp. OH3620_COT-345]|uniref:hypothetical protein n=1 Tax=Leptotrichia sp. OH3620_COT-345 TaxID=2491048 RepID=UPI000F65544D|nr:hypothetical protein [Leptotrichia sp. OH3620_COT-345]RRD37321.1 hypothetical protein EII29_11205 [Leptotrichia sp. OH3620_COT-345]
MKNRIKLLFLIFILVFIGIIIWTGYKYLNSEVYIFKSKKYNLKIIKEGTVGDDWISENAFYFIDYVLKENKDINKEKQSVIYEIGCSKLKEIGFDEEKGLFYGRLDFHSGIVSFRKNEVEIKKICSGYFILNMETGIYEGNLSLLKIKEKIHKLKLTEMQNFNKFMKKNGKKQKCVTLYECELPEWLKE